MTLYGREISALHKTNQARWYRGAGARVGRLVVVSTTAPFAMRAFFCTDGDRDATDVLLTYATRWTTCNALLDHAGSCSMRHLGQPSQFRQPPKQ